MLFPLIPLCIYAVLSPSFGSWLPDATKAGCPPKEAIKPCECSVPGQVTTLCKNISDVNSLKVAFDKNPNWSIQKVQFESCIMEFVPHSIAQYKNLETLVLANSTVSSVFDEPPIRDTSYKRLDIFMFNMNFRRAIEWGHFKTALVNGLAIFNTPIKHIGKDFKEQMPKDIIVVWFDNTETKFITDKAFYRLTSLEVIVVSGGALKTLSRDWFPRPCNASHINFSNHKISTLPEDMLKDFPRLITFTLSGNAFTTIDEKIFTRISTYVYLERNPIDCNCDLKWITTKGIRMNMLFFGNCDGPQSFKGKSLRDLKEKNFNFCQ